MKVTLNDKEIQVKDIKKVQCVVPVSGGKDSQLCLKLAVEKFGQDNVIGIFLDTKWDHPDTFKHLQEMRQIYQCDILWINNGSVEQEIINHKIFPGIFYRFCTGNLKIKPSKEFYSLLSENQGGFEVWLGMRSTESKARSKRYNNIIDNELYHPHEILPSFFPKYLGKRGVKFRLPILNLETKEVFNLLKNDKINPLYLKGHNRVGCFPCLASNSFKSCNNAYNLDEFGREQKKKVVSLERTINKKHNVSNTSQLCLICEI